MCYFNLPNHIHYNMKICSLSLHQGDTESRKTLKNNFIFQLGTLYIYTESMNVSHFIYLFKNSCHHVSTNGKAPPHPQKTNNTHNFSVRSDEGLTLVTSAFQIFHGGNSTFVISFDKTKFLDGEIRPQRCYSLSGTPAFSPKAKTFITF